MSADPKALLDLATAAAREAGVLLLERRRGAPSGLATKSTATDMVSDADRDAEGVILARLLAARPDDAIVAEEGGSGGSGGSGLRWLVDPLDGTTNFLYGIPQWAVSIACADTQGGLVGVVYDPVREELFGAARGAGAYLNGRRLAVTTERDLGRALLATGFSYVPAERRLQAELVARIAARIRDIRRLGSAALDLAWVAAGRYDGYFEIIRSPWDTAAGTVLVREAGGSVTEWPDAAEGVPTVIATAPGIHASLLSLFAPAKAEKRS